MDKTNSTIPARYLKRWAKMTDDNLHGEVRIEMARWLATWCGNGKSAFFTRCGDVFEAMLALLDYQGDETSPDCASDIIRAREAIVKDMIRNAAEIFGAIEAEKIYRCL
jgi:hypothetical protein